jgi:transcriptional regulator GlxA family with amidase domain
MRSQATHRLGRGGLAPWQLARAMRLLRSETPGDHTVAKLARVCGLSPSHFGRAFKASTGLTPHKWLLWFRVQRAAELLERTEDSISTIAVTCGFADQSHLTRVFHALMGTSPAHWRRLRWSSAVFGEPDTNQPVPQGLTALSG